MPLRYVLSVPPAYTLLSGYLYPFTNGGEKPPYRGIEQLVARQFP